MFHPNRTTPNTVATWMLPVLFAALALLSFVCLPPAPLAAQEFGWGTKLQIDIRSMEERKQLIPVSAPWPEWAAYAEGKWSMRDLFYFYSALENGSIRNPAWSPDGKWIAFNDYRKFLGIVPSGGGEPRMLWSGYFGLQFDEELNITGGDYRVWKTLGFTPDGKEVTFVKETIDHSRGTVTKTSVIENGGAVTHSISGVVPVISSIDIETGAERIVADPGLEGRWSHDGKFFVYTKWVQGTGYNVFRDSGCYPYILIWPKVGAGIWVKEMETGKEWLLTDREAMAPCFSPDDAYVFFTMKDSNGLYQIYQIPREGGVPRQLTYYGVEDDGRNAYLTDVSPDGEWLLHRGEFLANGENMVGLCAFNLVTGKSFLAFPNAEKYVGDGSWSGDSRKFAFSVATPQENSRLEVFNIYTVDFQPEPFWKSTMVSENVPVGFTIAGNHPNPFNPSTTISFTLPASGQASLSVYDITGRKVRDLISGPMSAGSHSAVWDGRDASGQPVSSGVYLSRLIHGGKAVSGRMLLVK